MKKIILGCLLLLFIRPLAAQELAMGVQLHESSVSAGYIFFAPVRGHSAYLINNEGQIVKEWRSEYEIFTALLLDDGTVLMGVDLRMPLGGWAILEAYAWEGELLWRFEYPDMHHAIRPMPNGNILIPAWNRFSAAEILAMGLKPELMSAPDITTNYADYDGMLLDKIIEVNPDCLCVVWEWRVQDHLVQDFAADAPNYGVIAAEAQRIDLNLANLRLPSDRPHINALDYNESLDQILISAHYFSEIWIIDHSSSTEAAAGTAGDLLYRWGNPMAYQRGTSFERQLYFQHDAQWLENGNILVFNNGMPIFRAYSSLTEIVPPTGYPLGFDTAYEPAEAVWDYRLDFHALNLGSVQRLANGHHFISDGTKGRIFEMDAAGQIVWDYLSPVFLEAEARSVIFKAWRISPESLVGRELVAGGEVPYLILDEVGD